MNGKTLTGVLAALFLTATVANAAWISANYCSVANVVTTPAGYYEADVWNDYTGPGSTGGFDPTDSASDPLYEDGTTATGTMFSWATSDGGSQNTNDFVNRPGDIDDGHDELMSGYLQASLFSSSNPLITLKGQNLDLNKIGDEYSVVLYFDGDADIESDTSHASFEVWESEASWSAGDPPLQAVYGRDKLNAEYPLANDGTAPLSEYTRITSTDEFNPTEGNYVEFEGLTNTEFYVRVTGVAQAHGVALNGFQIVPEPASMLLLALGGLGLIRRR